MVCGNEESSGPSCLHFLHKNQMCALHVTKLKKVRMLWSLENPEHFRSTFGPVRGLNLQPMHHFTLGQVTEIFLNSDKNDDRVFVTFNIQNTG